MARASLSIDASIPWVYIRKCLFQRTDRFTFATNPWTPHTKAAIETTALSQTVQAPSIAIKRSALTTNVQTVASNTGCVTSMLVVCATNQVTARANLSIDASKPGMRTRTFLVQRTNRFTFVTSPWTQYTKAATETATFSPTVKAPSIAINGVAVVNVVVVVVVVCVVVVVVGMCVVGVG